MPITLSAEKKLRQDVKRHEYNFKTLEAMKKTLKVARLSPNPKNITAAFSAIDTAAKKQVIHKNKAARLKSRLAKKIKPQKVKTANLDKT